MLPLLVAILALQVIFRFGFPYVWTDGFHWQPGIEIFWASENQIDLLQQISVNAILAFGMTLAILIGGIDLSVGALLALVGTTTVCVLGASDADSQSYLWLFLAVLAGLGAAGAFGAFNGLCAATTKMPAFIITLATMLIARGCAYRYNEARPMRIPDHETLFLELGNGRLFDTVPVPVVVMLLLFAAAAVLLHRTRFGQYVYAMGGNREAARFTGVPMVRVEIAVYTFCSLLAGIAGMIHTSQLYSAEPNSGVMFELNAIAATVVGGTSFSGGRGTMIGTLLGAVIIGLLDKGLNQYGAHFSLQYIVKGLVILAAVYIDVGSKRK
jgi:ribose transport system permease protein